MQRFLPFDRQNRIQIYPLILVWKLIVFGRRHFVDVLDLLLRIGRFFRYKDEISYLCAVYNGLSIAYKRVQFLIANDESL